MCDAMTERDRLTLVLGGTGKTGRRVASRLVARGLPVRIGSRSGEPPFDWERPSTWTAALCGVRAVYLTYQPDVAMPGAVDTIRSFVDRAAGAGVERIVMLSGRGEDEAQRAEAAVRAAAPEWTIVRCSWFAQNFSENFLLEPVVNGEVVLPAGDVGEPFVDVEDIADVAAAALTESGHAGQVYELTGPRLLSFPEAIDEIAQATGRTITYARVEPERFARTLAADGVPADLVWLLNYLFTTVLDGRNAFLGDGVQRALGRAPRDFRDYAREAAATGVWADHSGGRR